MNGHARNLVMPSIIFWTICLTDLAQMWCLIVSIPDLCPLSYYKILYLSCRYTKEYLLCSSCCRFAFCLLWERLHAVSFRQKISWSYWGVQLYFKISRWFTECWSTTFKHKVSQVYPIILELNRANSFNIEANFLSIDLSIANDITSSKVF